MREIRTGRIANRWVAAMVFLMLGTSGATCSSSNYLASAERELGTDSDLDRSFHVVADEPQGFGLRFPGLLIGIEKVGRGKIEAPRLDADPYLRWSPDGFSEETLDEYRSMLDDGKRTFISHIVESRLDTSLGVPFVRNHFLHDAYAAFDDGAVNGTNGGRRPSEPEFDLEETGLYAQSWESLAALEDRIAILLRGAAATGRPYTHVLVATMGWNTAQEKAIRNINSLFGNLLIASREDVFKPLYIAITWPSEWNIGGISLINKANDADEIGFVWANALLNDHLSELRDRSSTEAWPAFKIVALGHSLGARLMSRAAFSGAALAETRPLAEGVDLILGLQGAFSANRFLKERRVGQEGAPYAEYAQLRGRVALSWSKHDSANPITNFLSGANYVGGKPGWERAQDYPEHFAFSSVAADGALSASFSEGEQTNQVIMVDASELVRYEVLGAGGGAHSDIYNAYMGRFVHDLIQRLAP